MTEMEQKIADLTKTMDKITYLGNIAVREAQQNNLAHGVPNVYFINGKAVWEMPDGTFTDKDPF